MVFHDNVWDVCARMKFWFEISLALAILAKILGLYIIIYCHTPSTSSVLCVYHLVTTR